MAAKSISIRPIRPDDIDAVLTAHNAWYSYEDEYLERVTSPIWCLTEETLMDYIRQRETERSSETRTYAIECVQVLEEDGETIEVPWTCGGFSYELQDSLYGFLFISINPTVDATQIIEAIARFMREKLSKGGSRNEVRLWLRDCPQERLEVAIPAWQRAGFKFSVHQDWFGDMDGWLGVLKKRGAATIDD